MQIKTDLNSRSGDCSNNWPDDWDKLTIIGQNREKQGRKMKTSMQLSMYNYFIYRFSSIKSSVKSYSCYSGENIFDERNERLFIKETCSRMILSIIILKNFKKRNKYDMKIFNK